jgi:2-amino-4-hydroxy-6-hydroxymethyldihydropteridine diphosphokinase
VLETAPVGGPAQPPFLNGALALDCALEPAALLAACQTIEANCARTRQVRWGPRTLDLDLLLAGERGELVIATPSLQVPHPRLHERAFALAPLVELAPDLVHPTLGVPLAALLERAGGAISPTGNRV